MSTAANVVSLRAPYGSRSQPVPQRCTDCGETKAADAFQLRGTSTTRRMSYCRDCANQRGQVTRYARYGTTQEDVERVWKEQHGCCALCSREMTRNRIKGLGALVMCPDHDHQTGSFRALLCHRCNVFLGAFNGDIEMFQKAIDYLMSHQSVLADDQSADQPLEGK